MRNFPCNRRSNAAALASAWLLSALAGCQGVTTTEHFFGVNGEGIDIRPLAPLRVTFSEAPHSSASPYEDWALVFSAQGNQALTLVANGQRFPVTVGGGAQEFVYRVVQAPTTPPYQLVVKLPGSGAFAPATPCTGVYDPDSALTPPIEKPRLRRTQPEALVVNVHGFVTEIGVER